MIETEENNFDVSKSERKENMGQTDSQFKAFLRFLLRALKDATEETDCEKRDERMKEIIEDIQKTLED